MDTKMKRVWAVADGMISPFGIGSKQNYTAVKKGETAVRDFSFPETSATTFKAASITDAVECDGLTRFESICALALDPVIETLDLDRTRTLFILATTKGNIDRIGQSKHEAISLHGSAARIGARYGFAHTHVVSNACISGVLALIVAKRFLQSGKYVHAVVLGADVISPFVVSGFQSLQALSADVCRPFDATRSGINLGEAAAVMVLTTEPASVRGDYKVSLSGEGLSNDANHISGPSRTGEELALAISRALASANVKRTDIDFISSHGTATLYNDEMEARAFFISGLEGIPLNSLKGYYGHTLGAAGILESIISVRSLIGDELIGTYGFKTRGVSMPVKIAAKTQPWPLRKILKTASGFGGCNAAVIFEK